MAAVFLVLACTPPATGEDETTEGSSTGGSTSTGDPSSSSSSSGISATSSPDGTTDTTEVTTGEPSCDLPPVDPRIVETLRIHSNLPDWHYREVGSGAEIQLYVGHFGNTIPETIIPVPACVEWSVEPTDGVTLDATGMLFVDAAVPAGTTFTVTADVEEGRHVTMADFTVYEPVFYDFLGPWTEIQRLPCDGGAPFEPDPGIAELVFYGNSDFTLSFTGFENIIDFWGTFTYDPGTSALVLSIERPPDPPEGLDVEGTASVVDGQLVLEDMWLGESPEPKDPIACGHVFEVLIPD